MQTLQASLVARIHYRRALDEALKAGKLVNEAEKAATLWELKYKVVNKKETDLAASVKGKDDQMKAMKKEVEEERGNLALQATKMAGSNDLYEACQEEVKDCEAVFVMRK